MQISMITIKHIIYTTTTFLILIASQNVVLAKNPIVIYDNGKAINAQQFYPFKKPNTEDIKNIPSYKKKSIQRFPISSSMMSVGKVVNRKIINRMPRTICVVGDDKRSKKWVKDNRSKLSASNALCIVVNVKSESRFKSIKALAPDVDFQALNGDIFAKQLKIKHYPFLLNKNLLSQ